MVVGYTVISINNIVLFLLFFLWVFFEIIPYGRVNVSLIIADADFSCFFLLLCAYF